MSNNYFNSTGTIGFTCDVCGRELQSCTWINGMRFCAKCYQETFGNNTSQFVDLLNKEMYELKIADLEAKLAETEKELEIVCVEYKDKIREYIEINLEQREEIDKLNKIIKEKFELGKFKSIKELLYAYKNLEKEYTKSRQKLAIREQIIKENKELYDAKCFSLSAIEENYTQDKISFAVEQLKRVEKLLLDNAFNDLSVVLGEIENQIEELTRQHEDKGE